jgi:RND superfamily putative drug exporter
MRVRRRPALMLAVSLVFLIACTCGLLLWKTELNPVSQFRSANDSKQGFDIVKSAFPPGTVNPTSILVDRSAGPVRAEDLAAVSNSVTSVPGVQAVVDTGQRSTDGRAAVLSLIYTDDPFGHAALDRTQRIRDIVAKTDQGTRVLVGEGSGERLDARIATERDLKVVVPLVLLVVLTTLIILLRAIVAPLFLLATVVLSFAATLGLTLAIFRFVFGQHGFSSAMPVIIFIFLVALGSDYNIFLMSRVREEAARYGTREGTLNALAATGPVITSAGLILAGTFAVLTIIPSWDLSLIGFAVALGVLLDTFVVRSICVPAITWLVGERSWWPSSAKDGRKATLVTGVYSTEQLLGIKRKD